MAWLPILGTSIFIRAVVSLCKSQIFWYLLIFQIGVKNENVSAAELGCIKK